LFTIFAQYVGQPKSPGMGSPEELASYDMHICNLYQGGGVDIKEAVAKIRELNPVIKLIDCIGNAVYLLAEGASIQGSKSLNGTFSEEYILRDINGRKLVGWPKDRFLYNYAKPGVIDAVVDLHLRWFERSSEYMDGLFVDCIKPEFPFWSYDFDIGLNPQVDLGDGKPAGRETLNKIWAEAITEMISKLRDKLGSGVLLFGNQADFRQAEFVNGTFLEDYISYVADADHSHRTDLFLQKMSLYFQWQGKLQKPSFTFWTMPSGVDPGYFLCQKSEKYVTVLKTAQTLAHRMRFGLASTLMQDGYYSYDIHTRSRGAWMWFPEYGISLGHPVADAEHVCDGVYWREYQKGWAAVNATTEAIEIKFPEPVLLTKSGQTVLSIMLDDLDGLVVAKK
jgi:hypothetical protein